MNMREGGSNLSLSILNENAGQSYIHIYYTHIFTYLYNRGQITWNKKLSQIHNNSRHQKVIKCDLQNWDKSTARAKVNTQLNSYSKNKNVHFQQDTNILTLTLLQQILHKTHEKPEGFTPGKQEMSITQGWTSNSNGK